MKNANYIPGIATEILESCDDWQEDSAWCYSFFNAKLKLQLSPEFPAGAVVELITFEMDYNMLSIMRVEKEVFRCKLRTVPVLDS